SSISYDDAMKVIKNKFADAVSFQIRGPKDSTGVYSITVLEAGRMENATDTYYLDQYSGEIAGTYTFEQKNLGQQVRAYVKPVHTGSVFGMPSKIISLIVCVLGATFPVTGTIMWLNRLKKEKKRGV
ncbi:MAG TPA: PepSY domain-containing protein, partial [Sphingobacteriaceae bacterium]